MWWARSVRSGQRIGRVNEYVTNTASADDEQSTVTSDMSANMQRAAAALT
jgi:methyl-accepting chemotaxis protein